MKLIALVLAVAACSRPGPQSPPELSPVLATTARNTSDSVVAAVLYRAVVQGLPDFSAGKTVVVQNDSGFVSSSSLPRVDSVHFLLFDSSQVQDLANRIGQVNVLKVWKPVIGVDTARSGASNHYVWRQDSIRRIESFSVCAYRLRRISGAWQIDSTLGCIIT